MPHHRVDPRAAQAVALARTGMGTGSIAATVGAERSSVRRWLQAAGIVRKASPPQTRVEDATILAWHAAGWSLAEMAAAASMSKGGLEARLIAAQARANAPRRPPSVQKLVAMRTAGHSWSDLARASGQALSTVRRQVLAAMEETG